MGRRSRKRSLTGDAGARAAEPDEPGGTRPSSRAERDAERRRRRLEAATDAQGARRGRRGTGERPAAPWGRFPLSELVVLLAVVLGIASFLVPGQQGLVMLVAAFVLGSLAGLELAAREHFAGYRSHTTLLAACAAFAAGGIVVALPGPAPRVLTVAAAVAVFALAFWLLREAFKRRSGGLGFR
jgi:hypothetical protein